jgi:2-polyprenyl-3-methyl-5-hydroxy-6-metoxy-1,4-benzoquinol methylase
VEHFDDPVAAYETLALHYAGLSQGRTAYLRSVEQIICSHMPAGAHSLLDIGAADGSRAVRIAAQSAIKKIVLVEPSRAMVAQAPDGCEVRQVRVEELTETDFREKFDAITCLWNVLGHIRPKDERLRAVGAIGRLLSCGGRLFLDVNHRYNIRSYGIVRTVTRFLGDRLLPGNSRGDVLPTWSVAGRSISTYGHVFTHREIVELAREGGLEIEERLIVDYNCGSLHRYSFLGNLLYIFRRSSRRDSSSAPQTS